MVNQPLPAEIFLCRMGAKKKKKTLSLFDQIDVGLIPSSNEKLKPLSKPKKSQKDLFVATPALHSVPQGYCDSPNASVFSHLQQRSYVSSADNRHYVSSVDDMAAPEPEPELEPYDENPFNEKESGYGTNPHLLSRLKSRGLSLDGSERDCKIRLMDAVREEKERANMARRRSRVSSLSPYMIRTASIDYVYDGQELPFEAGDTDHEQGIKCVNRGLYHDAIPFLSKALQIQPENSEVVSLRCLCFNSIRNYPAALCDAKMLIRLNATEPSYWLRVADVYYSLRCYDKAKKAYKSALRYSTSHVFSRKVQQLYDMAHYRDNSFRISCPGLHAAKKKPVLVDMSTASKKNSEGSEETSQESSHRKCDSPSGSPKTSFVQKSQTSSAMMVEGDDDGDTHR